jgi:hypothetical protein
LTSQAEEAAGCRHSTLSVFEDLLGAVGKMVNLHHQEETTERYVSVTAASYGKMMVVSSHPPVASSPMVGVMEKYD